MIEIRFHGRGGQGAVTAVELVSQAAIAEGMFAQGFPNFGPERRGAPVTAFLRLSDSPIYLRERIDTPDVVVVLDRTLIGMVDVTAGLNPGKKVIVNAPPDQADLSQNITQCYTTGMVDATRIAMDTLGVPITNTAIIGALINMIGTVSLEAMVEPLKQRFGHLAEKNFIAMRKAFDETKVIQATGGGEATCEIPDFSDWDAYLSKEALFPWSEVEIGCDVHRFGSCSDFHTGNWRTAGCPVMDQDLCISCGLCWIMCPDMAFQPDGSGKYTWVERYCKGCGICVTACPKQALSMEEER